MKKMFVIGIWIEIVIPSYALTHTVSEAVQKKWLSVSITGMSHSDSSRVSSHYGKCMQLHLKNLQTTATEYSLDCGYLLQPIDSSFQDMLVTKSSNIKLQAGEQKTVPVYAMCTEANQRSPSEEMNFQIGQKATGSLLKMALYLQTKNYQSSSAQSAVWCLTNQHEITSITDLDTTIMYNLRRYVAQLKAIPIAQIYDKNVAEVTKPKITYQGSITVYSSYPAQYEIKLFDSQNKCIETITPLTQKPTGEVVFNYNVLSEKYNDRKYFLRFYKDGKLEDEIKLEE